MRDKMSLRDEIGNYLNLAGNNNFQPSENEICKMIEKRIDKLIKECENEQKEMDKFVYVGDWDNRMAEKKRGALSAQIGAYIRLKNNLEFDV